MQAVPRARASARRRSPRSRACSARAMARLAATTSAAFVEAFLKAGDSEDDVAERFAALAEQLMPALDPVLSAAFKRAPARGVRRGMLGRAERATGQVGGRAGDRGVLRRPGRVHAARSRGRGAASSAAWPAKLAELANDVAPAAGAAGQDDRRRGDVRQPRPGRAGRRSRCHCSRPSTPPSCRACAPGSHRAGAAARRRLLRSRGQSGQPRHRRRSSRQRPVHAGGPRRGSRPVRLVVRAAGTSSRACPSRCRCTGRGAWPRTRARPRATTAEGYEETRADRRRTRAAS